MEEVSKGAKLRKIKVKEAGVLHNAAMWVRHRLFPQNAVAASSVCISGRNILLAYKHLSSCYCF